MSPRIYLSLAMDKHQPVGNFDWIFERAFERAYLPLVECLERHPGVRLALHYTGPLRDWLREHRPDFWPRVRRLVERGQVEIMGGAYYEPVLVSLRPEDVVGQIQKMAEAIRQDFGVSPSGFWLAERIWEPHLPRVLSEAGAEYTIVDDAHFKAVGYTDQDLLGYYVTEEAGCPLKVFATSMPLRYTIPWKAPDEVIGWLREQSEADHPRGLYLGRTRVAVMGDDGEKFGLWPGTFEYVWQKGWMDRFFQALEDNADWLGTIPPGEAAAQFPGLGRAYLASASYEEMSDWSLPPGEAWALPQLRRQLEREGRTDITRYLHGGFWRQFMVKYDEVNQLHKKSLWVSRKVHAMPDGEHKRLALDELWSAQCNCAYWHGVFGGVYLFHIRQTDYEKLIRAENLADGLGEAPAGLFARADVADFDLDAQEDVVLSSDRQTLVLDLDQGGSLVEWDYRPLAMNLTNVMTRRPEGYHQQLIDAVAAGRVAVVAADGRLPAGGVAGVPDEIVRVREPGLHTRLIYDWHRRASFLDHFLAEDSTLDSFYRSRYSELGDFVNQPYQYDLSAGGGGSQLLTLRREGHVWRGFVRLPVTVEKTLALAPGSDWLRVGYTVINGDGGEVRARFGVETNWGLAGGDDGDHTYLTAGFARYSLAEISSNDEIDSFAITSKLWGVNIDVEVDLPATLWRFPLETISASEGGFERNYQGTTLLLWWPLRLAPGEGWRVTLSFTLSSL